MDPRHRSLGQFFQDETASPLDLDFYIRLPVSIPVSRLAVIDWANPFKALRRLPFPLMLATMNPRSVTSRALVVNPGDRLPLDEERVYARNLEVPSGGGVGNIRGLQPATLRKNKLLPDVGASANLDFVARRTHGFTREGVMCA